MKMIQFETVKYGILKKSKDTQRSSAKGDLTTSYSEDDVLLPESNSLTTDQRCISTNDPSIGSAYQDIDNNKININSLNDTNSKSIEINEKIMSNSSDDKMETQQTDIQETADEQSGHVIHDDDDGDEDDAAVNITKTTSTTTTSSTTHQHHHVNDEDDKLLKQNEDVVNNNENDGNTDPSLITDNKHEHENGELPFPSGGYFSLEALQKMSQLVSNAMATNTDNEAAQKQWALLQSTLFTLQHQQLFQLQLIQQLQSQLSINRSDTEMDDDLASNKEERLLNDTNSQDSIDKNLNDDENRDSVNDISKIIKIEKSELDEDDEDEIDDEDMINEDELEDDEVRDINESDCEQSADKYKNHMSALGPTEPAYSSSTLASNIITNHDPPLLDCPNSLEMLQKTAEEVLDSASKGILSGNLTDELAFKSDGKGGRNEPFFKHRCRYCGKVFGSDSALQIHIRSHTGERPFKCNVCGSRFTTKGNLKVHFQRHTTKFPHIQMNPNPIPEHLDKFYPPLLPQPAPGQPPLSPSPPPPPTSTSSNIRPPPVPMNLPFPPIPGMPALPSLPLFRPPYELLKQMGQLQQMGGPHHMLFEAMREAAQMDQELPADLSKTFSTRTPSPKPINKSDEKDLREDTESPKSNKIQDESEQQHNHDKGSSASPPPTPKSWKSDTKDRKSSPHISENLSPNNHHQHHHHHHHQPQHHRDQPENLIKSSILKHSPPLTQLHNSLREPYLEPSEIKIFPSMLPRPGSNDNSWESFIEVDKSSETSKLQQLVDNIENKITDPNECVVCHKVLSCRSALQMHYRTHTGERPFRCKICGRAFTTKGNLKTHMSVHRMKPPMRTIHQCPVCHKKFTNSLVLQQHIRLHTGEPTDLTLEQIQAAEIRDFTSISPGSFPLGMNPFAFPMPGLPSGAIGPESSNGDNEDYMMDDDMDDDISNFDDRMSNTGSISGDSNQNISNTRIMDESNQSKDLTMITRSKSIENLSRTASTPKSHTDSMGDKSPANVMLNTKRPSTPINSPAPSDTSQGALDLTPRSESSAKLSPQPNLNHLNQFGRFPFLSHGPVTTSSPLIPSALNSLVSSASPMGPFNPMALAGMRGNTTCKICFKTFACQSALEIHYRSHTKERPYKCSICDKAFTTKNEELIHTSLHFQVYGNMKQHMMTHKLREMQPNLFGSNQSIGTQPSNLSNDTSNSQSSNKEQQTIRVKSEAELSPRSIESTDDHMERQRSLPSQYRTSPDNFSSQHHTNSQLSIKVEQSLRRPSIDEPNAKRPHVSPVNERDSPKKSKDSSLHQKPIIHDDLKETSSHLERLQQHFQNQSSLLNQPLQVMDMMTNPQLRIPSGSNGNGGPGNNSSSGNGNSDADNKHFCHVCQKNFSSTSALQIHMRTHTGERPFICHVCQKAFTTKGNLKVHMGIHTWSGASRRGRRMSLELPFNGSMPLMLQNPELMQRHPDFFHPYPPNRSLMSRLHGDRGPHPHHPPPGLLNLAGGYGLNGLTMFGGGPHNLGHLDRSPYISSPSPNNDKRPSSATSPHDEDNSITISSPQRNGGGDDLSPTTRTSSPDLSPRMWKLHYESKTVNRDTQDDTKPTSKPVEEIIA